MYPWYFFSPFQAETEKLCLGSASPAGSHVHLCGYSACAAAGADGGDGRGGGGLSGKRQGKGGRAKGEDKVIQAIEDIS